MNASRGSITLLVLMLLSIISLLTQAIINRAVVQHSYDQFMVLREQAKSLAIAGIYVAGAQLTLQNYGQPPTRSGSSGEQVEDKDKLFLSNVLPTLNQMQTFKLSADSDGSEGTISICITCENGKFNINKAFDFAAREFREPYKSLFGRLSFRMPNGGGTSAAGVVLEKITDYMNKQGRPLRDVSA